MTIRELMERLKDFPADAQVEITFDSGCAGSEIDEVELDPDGSTVNICGY